MKTKVVSFEEAADILASDKVEEFSSLISICDPDTNSPEGFTKIPNVLRLEYFDVDLPLYLSGAHVKAGKERIPSRIDMIHLISFLDRLKDKEGTCLIHCHAGMSRSPAAAFIAHALQLGPGEEEEALQRALNSCSQYWVFPNDIMVSIADDLLNRSGKMIKCLHQQALTNNRMY